MLSSVVNPDGTIYHSIQRVVYTLVLLLASTVIWYWPCDGDAAVLLVTMSLAEINGSITEFMTNICCRFTINQQIL